jgi:hypothetical protein
VGVGEAVLHLRQNPKGLALVREKLDGAFHKALGGRNGSVELLEKIEGVNYTKGKRMTLNLYGNIL